MDPLNPLAQIKSSCSYVNSVATHVKIDTNKIIEFANILEKDCNYSSFNADGWHYTEDASVFGPMTAQYIFVLDSLNFCFWPCPTLEYEQLASILTKVLKSDSHAFDAIRLQALTKEDIARWFVGYDIPLLEERVDRLRELGFGLTASFDGLAANVVRAAKGSCVSLVQLLLSHFPGFRDTVMYRGRLIHLYKRVQILVGDVWAAYGGATRRNSSSNSIVGSIGDINIYDFTDIDQLTMFADYRVPQILRVYGILIYSSELAAAVDSRQEVQSGSSEEVEIRACTVVAVELLREEMMRRGKNLLSIELDWLLWQKGEAVKDQILPHHRTLTIYY